jgi:uncharacterized Zn finger protein
MDWDYPDWYARGPKQPPPQHGIKIKKTGTTWWGQRWVEALDRMSAEYANRLGRGRTYARAGRTHDLVVKAGLVTAKVTGSRPTPYDVTIKLKAFSAAQWEKAIVAMGAKAQFSSELLTGEMPKNIDDVFRDAGVSLFPKKESDLVTECSCPDWANPCKHVAAAHYVLGEAFDRDPFLLFELRGRSKREVLDALRSARTGGAIGDDAPESDTNASKVTLEGVDSTNYDKPREPLPVLHLSFDEPAVHGAVLQQLGTPAVWTADASPADLLTPLLRATAAKARRIALAESVAADETPLTSERKQPTTKLPRTKRRRRERNKG